MSRQDFSGKQVGHYLLSSLLGCGAAGSVYKAVDTTLAESPPFAIKCIQQSHNARRRRQQFAEIDNHDMVASCPHIMTLCDVFEEDRYLFLVFPLFEMDMFRAIWKEKVYWRNDALIKEVFLDILDGVFECHRRHVYHRDLKPENIMCNTEGRDIKIGDFGLSADRHVCDDGGCGTSYYMSPECVDEEAMCYYTGPADIWSLGIILFNMVACRYPWKQASDTDDAYLTFTNDTEYLLRTTPISQSLSALLYKIWDPTPLSRLSIPAIREEILDMDTFYKPRRPSSSSSASPLSKELTLLIDSEQTCVTAAEDATKKDKHVESPSDTLAVKEMSLALNSEKQRRVTLC